MRIPAGGRSARGPIVLGLIALAVIAAPARAQAPAGATDTVSTFAAIPDPGHPFGVFYSGRKGSPRRVYVTTSHGNPMHPSTRGNEALFELSTDGALLSHTRVHVPYAGPVSTMGLYGMAMDGEGRLYVGDMNGRVLRYRLRNGQPVDEERYAEVPMDHSPHTPVGWGTSMWNGLTFDREGNLYVADNDGPIWRIPPTGHRHPRIWFEDERLQGGIAGSWGVEMGADGKLYILTVASGHPETLTDSLIHRLPVVDHPRADQLERVAKLESRMFQPAPAATGMAFGRSGRIYLGLAATPRTLARMQWAEGNGEVVVLAPNGRIERRIQYPLFDSPMGVTFLGNSLLVANTNFSPVEDPGHWAIFKVDVGEPGLPEPQPKLEKPKKKAKKKKAKRGRSDETNQARHSAHGH